MNHRPHCERRHVTLRIGHHIALAALVAAAITLTGCRDRYDGDYDTISPYAGDAIARNIAVQTYDPWPPAASRTHQRTDGQRAVNAYRTYRSGGTGGAADGGTQSSTDTTAADGTSTSSTAGQTSGGSSSN